MGALDFRKRVRTGQNHPEERRALEKRRVMGPPQREMIGAINKVRALGKLKQTEYERAKTWLNAAPISEERRAEALQDLEDVSHEIKDAGKAIAAFRMIRNRNDFRHF